MECAPVDISDALDGNVKSCEKEFRGYGGRERFAGPVTTIQCFRDNGLVRRTLNGPGAGGVLVVDGGGSLASALMGDLIAAAAIAQGWSGVIINGAVRDVAVLRTLDLGIKALGSNPRKSAKVGDGAIDVPVSFRAVTFTPA